MDIPIPVKIQCAAKRLEDVDTSSQSSELTVDTIFYK